MLKGFRQFFTPMTLQQHGNISSMTFKQHGNISSMTLKQHGSISSMTLKPNGKKTNNLVNKPLKDAHLPGYMP